VKLEFTGLYDAAQRNFDAIAPAIKRLAQRVTTLEASVTALEADYDARVYNSGNIVVTSGAALAALTFDSERFDNGGLHSTASNTSRLTAPVAGLYLVGASVRWAANATGYRHINLVVNGAGASIARQLGPAASGIVTYQTVETIYELAANDYVEVQVQQNSGGNLNIEANASSSPEFWMRRLRA
jgi:hypothetical protein